MLAVPFLEGGPYPKNDPESTAAGRSSTPLMNNPPWRNLVQQNSRGLACCSATVHPEKVWCGRQCNSRHLQGGSPRPKDDLDSKRSGHLQANFVGTGAVVRFGRAASGRSPAALRSQPSARRASPKKSLTVRTPTGAARSKARHRGRGLCEPSGGRGSACSLHGRRRCHRRWRRLGRE